MGEKPPLDSSFSDSASKSKLQSPQLSPNFCLKDRMAEYAATASLGTSGPCDHLTRDQKGGLMLQLTCSIAAPQATTIAAIIRRIPKGSFKASEPIIAAITTLVSRSATT